MRGCDVAIVAVNAVAQVCTTSRQSSNIDEIQVAITMMVIIIISSIISSSSSSNSRTND